MWLEYWNAVSIRYVLTIDRNSEVQEFFINHRHTQILYNAPSESTAFLRGTTADINITPQGDDLLVVLSHN